MEGNKGGELMQAERQNNQLVLAFGKRSEGKVRSGACEGTEVCVARADTESPAAGPTMEEVLEPGNLKKALERVRRNKGASVAGRVSHPLGYDAFARRTEKSGLNGGGWSACRINYDRERVYCTRGRTSGLPSNTQGRNRMV